MQEKFENISRKKEGKEENISTLWLIKDFKVPKPFIVFVVTPIN